MIELTTVDSVRTILSEALSVGGGAVRSVPVRFPTGRMGHINPSDPNFEGRVRTWLRRYRVSSTWDERSEEQVSRRIWPDRYPIRLYPLGFAYRLTMFASSPQRLAEHVRDEERDRSRIDERIRNLQSEIIQAESIFHAPRHLVKTEEIEEAIKDWPEAVRVFPGGYSDGAAGVQVSVTSVGVGFVPAVFVITRGHAIALTSPLLAVTRPGGDWHDGQQRVAHPHVRGGYCLGNMVNTMRTLARSNQVIGAFDLIRRWRLGYNSEDAYGRDFSCRAWKILADIRGGFTAGLPGWDGDTVQRADTGEIVPLASLVDDVDMACHAGMSRTDPYLSRETIGSGAERSTCAACDGVMVACSCHNGFCLKCHENPSKCICEGSRRIIFRGPAFWVILKDDGADPGCAYCGRSSSAVIYSGADGLSPSSSRTWFNTCMSCLRRQYPDTYENREMIEERIREAGGEVVVEATHPPAAEGVSGWTITSTDAADTGLRN